MTVEAQKFILRKGSDLERSRDIGRVCQSLEELPQDRDLIVTIEEKKSERTLAQNAYLFGAAYPPIMEATGYEKEDIHEEFCKRHFGVKLKRVPKCRDYPDGLKEVPVRTTTTDENGKRSVLGKLQFAEFVAFVQRFAAEKLDLVIPDPDPDYALHKRAA